MPFVPLPYDFPSVSSYISIDKVFSWNILSLIQISQVFSWDVGDGPLYWFQVEAYPVNSCPSVDAFTQIDTVMATGIDDLCERLTELRYNRKIKSVKKWSIPALECDVQKDIQNGISHFCNSLIPVDFCSDECLAYIEEGDCPELFTDSIVWFSEYYRLNNSIVNIGDQVIQGQKLGEIKDYLHFGVGDGQVGGNIGQTLNFDDYFFFPAVETRPAVAPANPTIFTDEEITYIKAHTVSPVNKDLCSWSQLFGSSSNADYEYYAMDIYCSDILDCYNACGGIDIDSEVIDVQSGVDGFSIIIQHTRLPATSFAMMAVPEMTLMKNIEEKKELLLESSFGEIPLSFNGITWRGRKDNIFCEFSRNIFYISIEKDKKFSKITLQLQSLSKNWDFSLKNTIVDKNWKILKSTIKDDLGIFKDFYIKVKS